MSAWIDTTKGHHQHGHMTVHVVPDICHAMNGVTEHQCVNENTAASGIAVGQWIPCPDCSRSWARFYQSR